MGLILIKKINMSQTAQINQGEILIKFNTPTKGQLTFSELGITDSNYALEGGF
jgi:hypothetical protein